MFRQLVVAALLCLLALSCSSDDDASTRSSRAAGGNSTFALLADRTLLKVSSETGIVAARESLGLSSPVAQLTGNYLAPSLGQDSLFVLVPAAPARSQSVAVVDVMSGRLLTRYPLPPGIVFRTLVVGPRSGRLYIAGNRSAGGRALDVVMAVIDASNGETVLEQRVRPAKGYDWLVFGSAISPDERYLFLSYHGRNTSGADVLSISRGRLDRCPGPPVPNYGPNNGCLARVHGSSASYEGHILATGERQIMELDLSGRVLRRRFVGLPKNHLMAFALDARRARLAVIGSCGYSGGLSLLDLKRDRRRVVGYPGQTICGEAVEYVGRSMLAIAKNPQPVAQGGSSAVLFVDGERGQILTRTSTDTEVLDLLALPSGG